MKRFLSTLFALILALAALPATGEGNPFEPLAYGDRGERVAELQTRLSELGYYTGKISGNYLDGTRNGVKRFQKDYSLEVTGAVSELTWGLLMNAEYRSLAHGDSGDDVKRVQQHLSQLGYYSGKISGNYLDGTRNGIAAFQERNGLEATGTADISTQRLLFSGSAMPKEGVLATPDPAQDLGDINDVVMVEDGEENVEIAYEKKLQRGAKGESVKRVQQRLTELGFFDGPISGNYMNQTVAAVKDFQTMNGLHADGVTGDETWTLLFNSPDVLDAQATPKPTPVPTPVPYAITVDVRNQVTTVYGPDEQGNYTVPVRRMICSTGLKATPSDVGDWVLNGRRARWAYFSKWGSHAQYWVRINPYIAFHSVIYNTVDNHDLSVKSYKKLGQRASHGCIRLLVSDARWMYENIFEGVVVTITEELPSDEELRMAVVAPPLNYDTMLPCVTPQPTAEPAYRSDAAPPLPFRKLKKGMEGEDVYWLQSKLRDLGFYTGAVTGAYYSGTQKAVKEYQRANKIYPTGEADERTLGSLYADVLPTPTPEATETPTPAPTPAPTFTPQPTASPAPVTQP